MSADRELDGLGEIPLDHTPQSASETQEVGGVILPKVEGFRAGEGSGLRFEVEKVEGSGLRDRG